MSWETIGNATLYLGDCREILPDLSGSLTVVTDPPYGLGSKLSGGSWGQHSEWDVAPDDLYGLIWSYPHSVIWGGNYFKLPPSRGWLIWHKPDANKSAADVEMAWTSLDRNSRLLSHTIASTRESEGFGFHPNQKPIRVMEWSIEASSAPGLICDPFMGSGTTGVACVNLNRSFIGIEKEPVYFDIACKRIEAAYAQGRLFA